MGSDVKILQEQLVRFQEIVLSLAGVTHILLHDNNVSGTLPEYEPLDRDKRQGLFLAQKNLLFLAESELENLNMQFRRYQKAYNTLRNQRNESVAGEQRQAAPAEAKTPAPKPRQPEPAPAEPAPAEPEAAVKAGIDSTPEAESMASPRRPELSLASSDTEKGAAGED
mgnify:CR=1 FL=1